MTTLVYLTLAWTAGLLLGRALRPPPLLLGALGIMGFVWLLACRHHRGRYLAPALLIAALLGIGRYLLAMPPIDVRHLAHYNESGPLSLQGYISAEPSVRDTYLQIEVSAETLFLEERLRSVHGKAVVRLPLYEQYEYGDAVRLTGSLETPPILEGFNYREYLAARGIHSLMWYPKAVRLAGNRGGLLRYLYRLKRHLHGLIASILPNPEAGLLSGILLGLEHTLPDDLYAAFRLTGLLHIIVISGYNMGLLLQATMMSVGRFVHRWLVLALCLLALLLYTLFIGPNPPVTRAALLGGLFVVGQLLGRKRHLLTSLAAASLLMTLWEPLQIWGVSFQLSFAATLALVLLQPALERLPIPQKPGPDDASPRPLQGLFQILLATLSAQILTLPILWYHFGQLSLVSLPANLLVQPAQPAIMLFGSLATAGGALWLPLGRALAWLVWPLLRYCTLIAQALAALPWAAVELPALPPWALWLLYGPVLLFLAGRRLGWGTYASAFLRATRRAQASTLLAALLSASIWGSVLSLPDQRLHLYALDVGQGDAILLRTPGGHTVLIDGGPDPLALTSRLGHILPFWQRRLDLVIATHADGDHLTGLLGALERYQVRYAMEPASMGQSPLSAQWHEMLAARGIPLIQASRHTQVRLGRQVQLTVLHPQAQMVYTMTQDDNRDSLVVRLEMGRCRILLMADVDMAGEADLLRRGDLAPATILKVAHHGAAASSAAAFLAAVAPRIALISVGAENRFGHPAAETLRRLERIGCQVYRTDQHGTIACITDGKRLWIKTQRRGGGSP